MLNITPSGGKEVTKVICPQCHEKVPRIGIPKGSIINCLTFKCRKCGKLWEVKTEE